MMEWGGPRSLLASSASKILEHICSKTLVNITKNSKKNLIASCPEICRQSKLNEYRTNSDYHMDYHSKYQPNYSYWVEQLIGYIRIDRQIVKLSKHNQSIQHYREHYDSDGNERDGEFKLIKYTTVKNSIKCEYLYYCNQENNNMEAIMDNIRVTTFNIDDLVATAERKAQSWYAVLSSHLPPVNVVQILEKALGHLFTYQEQILEFDMFIEFLQDLILICKILAIYNYRGIILQISTHLHYIQVNTARKLVEHCGLSDVISDIEYCRYNVLDNGKDIAPHNMRGDTLREYFSCLDHIMVTADFKKLRQSSLVVFGDAVRRA